MIMKTSKMIRESNIHLNKNCTLKIFKVFLAKVSFFTLFVKMFTLLSSKPLYTHTNKQTTWMSRHVGTHYHVKIVALSYVLDECCSSVFVCYFVFCLCVCLFLSPLSCFLSLCKIHQQWYISRTS